MTIRQLMEIPWESSRCILCFEEKPLTCEHIIPKCIGGKLVAKFLCKDCNSSLGSKIEANIRFAPEIRVAVSHLKEKLPDLYDSIEARQKYETEIGGEKVTQVLSGNDGVLGERMLSDGSLIVPELRAEQHIKRMLEKNENDKDTISAAVEYWKDAPFGKTIKLSDDLSVKKWEQLPSSPKLTGCSVSALVILKIAYEFIALLIGSEIFTENPDFGAIRTALKEQDENAAQDLVLLLEAAEFRPFHGIALEGNQPISIIQIRLFGKLAYRVVLQNTTLEVAPILYTFILDSNEHDFRYAEGSK